MEPISCALQTCWRRVEMPLATATLCLVHPLLVPRSTQPRLARHSLRQLYAQETILVGRRHRLCTNRRGQRNLHPEGPITHLCLVVTQFFVVVYIVLALA